MTSNLMEKIICRSFFAFFSTLEHKLSYLQVKSYVVVKRQVTTQYFKIRKGVLQSPQWVLKGLEQA